MNLDFILAQAGDILPVAWISYIVVGVLTFWSGITFMAFVNKPKDLETRLHQLERALDLNKQADEYRLEQMQEIKQMQIKILEALAKKI